VAPGSRRESGLAAQFIAVFTGRGIRCVAMLRKTAAGADSSSGRCSYGEHKQGPPCRSRGGQGSVRRSAPWGRIRAYGAMQQRNPAGARRVAACTAAARSPKVTVARYAEAAASLPAGSRRHPLC
jgi:hypothetical protein